MFLKSLLPVALLPCYVLGVETLQAPLGFVATDDLLSGLPSALVAKECPKDMKCGSKPDLIPQPIYNLPVSYVTVPRIHKVSTTHTITSKTYLAKVETVVGVEEGICEKYVPTTITTRPTVTVWVDQTTTVHHYTSTLETEELTHRHTVTETIGCIKEIDAPTSVPASKITQAPRPAEALSSAREEGGAKGIVDKAGEKPGAHLVDKLVDLLTHDHEEGVLIDDTLDTVD